MADFIPLSESTGKSHNKYDVNLYIENLTKYFSDLNDRYKLDLSISFYSQNVRLDAERHDPLLTPQTISLNEKRPRTESKIDRLNYNALDEQCDNKLAAYGQQLCATIRCPRYTATYISTVFKPYTHYNIQLERKIKVFTAGQPTYMVHSQFNIHNRTNYTKSEVFGLAKKFNLTFDQVVLSTISQTYTFDYNDPFKYILTLTMPLLIIDRLLQNFEFYRSFNKPTFKTLDQSYGIIYDTDTWKDDIQKQLVEVNNNLHKFCTKHQLPIHKALADYEKSEVVFT